MDEFALRLRSRFVPAVLSALGVALLTAGLLTYTAPVEAGPEPSQVPTIVTLPPTPTPTVTARPSGAPTPSPVPTAPADRVATRVVIAALGIDLPVIRQPDPKPACDVAMYTPELSQPGMPGATYIYAHAQAGMFLPMLEASKIDNGAKMLGMIVEVYTSDDQLFLYEIYQVRRHVPFEGGYVDAFAATDSELWLQTSEGVGKFFPKLQLVAQFLSSGPADNAASHPDAKPRVCG